MGFRCASNISTNCSKKGNSQAFGRWTESLHFICMPNVVSFCHHGTRCKPFLSPSPIIVSGVHLKLHRVKMDNKTHLLFKILALALLFYSAAECSYSCLNQVFCPPFSHYYICIRLVVLVWHYTLVLLKNLIYLFCVKSHYIWKYSIYSISE